MTQTPSAESSSGAMKISPAGRFIHWPGGMRPSSIFHSRPSTRTRRSVPDGAVTRISLAPSSASRKRRQRSSIAA